MLLRIPLLPFPPVLEPLLATGLTGSTLRLPHAVGMPDPIPPTPLPGTLHVKLTLLGRQPTRTRRPLPRIQCLNAGSPAIGDESRPVGERDAVFLGHRLSAPSTCDQSQSTPVLDTTTQLTRRVSLSVVWQS